MYPLCAILFCISVGFVGFVGFFIIFKPCGDALGRQPCTPSVFYCTKSIYFFYIPYCSNYHLDLSPRAETMPTLLKSPHAPACVR